MAFGTKDPNSVGGTRKPAGRAQSTIDAHKGDSAPMGKAPTPRMPTAYLTKNHAPYDAKRKRAANSIAEPPTPTTPKLDVTRMACTMPMLKTSKAD